MVRIVLIVVALIVALISGRMVQVYLTAQRQHLAEEAAAQKPQVLPAIEVLVVTADTDIASEITPDRLGWQAWPEAQLNPRYITRKAQPDAIARLVGSATRQPLFAGEPVTEEKLIKKNEASFLAALLSEGRRAISIRIDEATGLVGLLQPGDRVDVVLSHEIVHSGGSGGRDHASETIARNLRVLAIDHALKAEDSKGGKSGGKTVTLEVNPAEAEVLALGRSMGTLSLSVRSAFGSSDAGRGRGYVIGNELSAAMRQLGGHKAAVADQPNSVVVFHGAKPEVVTLPP